jgi:hypothetical protein
MTRKNRTKCLTGAALFGFATHVLAAPFAITYSDTTSSAVPSAGINGGELATIKLILDNGNASALNQTWTGADAKCVIFTFNTAQNLFVAINYSAVAFPTATGTFTTNGSGVLQSAASDWEDGSDPVLGTVSTNISGSTPIADWFIDGENQVMDLNDGVVSFTNVANNVVAANWTNPAPDSGVCGSAPPPPPPRVQQPIPTLNEWAMVLLSGLLISGGVFSLRRKRK